MIPTGAVRFQGSEVESNFANSPRALEVDAPEKQVPSPSRGRGSFTQIVVEAVCVSTFINN